MINYILIVTLLIGFGLICGILLAIEDMIGNRLDKIITILKDIDHKG